MALVESIPQHMKYKANATLGIPLEKVWKDLISMATAQVDISSFYWTLTGEDINVNSSSDTAVSYQLKQKETPSLHIKSVGGKGLNYGEFVLCREETS